MKSSSSPCTAILWEIALWNKSVILALCCDYEWCRYVSPDLRRCLWILALFFFCIFFYLCKICSHGSPLKPPTVWWQMHTLCVFILSFLHRILAWALSISKLPFYIQICCLALCSHWSCHLSLKKVTSVLSFSAVVSDKLRLKYAIYFFQSRSLKFWSWNTSVWMIVLSNLGL